MYRTFLSSFLIVLCLFSTSLSAEIYRWVDEDGVTHFSDQKPKGQKSDQIKIKVTEPAGSGSASHSYDPQKLKENEARFMRAMEAEKRLKEQRKAELAKKEQERQDYCKSLNKELTYYREGFAMMETNTEGKVSYLSDDEIKRRRADLEKLWQERCQGQP